MVHVLVTGASSFVGRHVTSALLARGLRVTGTYFNDSARANLATKASQAELVRLDLARNSDFLALPKAIDIIVHIAGISVVPATGVDEVLSCNVAGAQNLLRYARQANAQRLIYASTLSVHGDILEPYVDEVTPSRAPGVYGASKLLAERIFAAESERLPCVALRLPGVLGRGAHRAWIPTLLEKIKNNADITIYNAQSPFNNATHLNDLGAFVVSLVQCSWNGFHAFPVGAKGQIMVREVVDTLISEAGSRSKVLEGSAAKGPFMISSAYASTHFGYAPMEIQFMIRQYVRDAM